MTLKLIGIHGKKRAGKDTAGIYIRDILNYDKVDSVNDIYNMDSFAEPLRKFGYMTFGITEKNREEMIEAIGVTGRQVLQLIGTEVGRNIHPNFWIESLKYRNPKMTGLIITDVRFNNEAEFVKSHGGTILKVVRPELENNIDTHSSEIPIDEKYVDHVIMNDSTKEVYLERINLWLNSYTK